jgi:deazaflavin-dependent oxidoreductase (nitroreductase family)
MKHRLVHALQKYILNPPVRLLLPLGVLPPTYAMLETTGRKIGEPRRNPVGNGLEGDQFWIVAEHGHNAGYVRNIAANPRVRVKARKGLKLHWRTGTAHILPDDDPRARQATFTRGRPGRWVNAFVVRTLGTQLLTVRIDLDPDERS